MQSILNKFFSMKIAVFFLFIFALACAIATFIENDFGTQTALALVYGAKWFEAIQLYLGLLVFYNLFRYNLFRKEKFPSLIFHFAFIIILLGSGLTRYFGYEGIIHIREGQVQNRIISTESFITIQAKKDEKKYQASLKKLISRVGNNSFTLPLQIENEKAILRYKILIPNATQRVVEDLNGVPIISLMLSDNTSKPQEATLNANEEFFLQELKISFEKKEAQAQDSTPTLQIFMKNGKFYFLSNQEVSWFKMQDSSKGKYEPNQEHPFVTKQLYTINGINIVPKAILAKGSKKWVSQKEVPTNFKNLPSVIVGELTYKGESKEVNLLGFGRGSEGIETKVSIADELFTLKWGSKVYALPFSLELIDFQLDRYPGSMSPSSYASEVKVIDKKNSVTMPYRIYMNHVLDYQGFRFFQSSYDKDELGTILSVNQDPGKIPTYIGYFLLFLGLLMNIVNSKSRFRKLAKSINQESMRQGVKALSIILLFFTCMIVPNTLQADNLAITQYDKTHANYFGKIIVQSADGRMKPVDTLAHEVLNKVYQGYSYQGLTPNQVFLGMLTNPQIWQDEPMIKVFDKNLKKLIGINEEAKYATFNDFFEKVGQRKYKLARYAEEANRKKPANRNRFDKDVIKVDERLNICYYVYTGEILRMIPKIGDRNKRWFTPKVALTNFPKEEAQAVQIILEKYFNGVTKGLKSGDWREANKGVEHILSYQRQFANDILPSQNRIETEINFNNFQIFEKLTPIYLLAGFVLLITIFAKMLAPSINLKWIIRIVLGIIALSFIAHTIGLGMRWYISKHAPWSDAYESMIYIAWALTLSGILFSRKSPISLSLTAILTGVALFVAHLAWMDPQITNLVPVLKSYWLTIHVSVITASYGFLGLCSLLGFFTLVLFIIRNPKNNDKRSQEIDRNINEATKINEMAMILGLTLLTIGNFLGGVWANESWGRYWGWDAKETWALISILIYACVVHFRFIPKLNNQYAFAVASTFAYWSIIMTYFGVNFYLSGMHSYAAGDPIPIPIFIPIIALVMFIVSFFALFRVKLAKPL